MNSSVDFVSYLEDSIMSDIESSDIDELTEQYYKGGDSEL